MSRINTLIREIGKGLFVGYDQASICGGVHTLNMNVEDFVPCLSTPCTECPLSYQLSVTVGRISSE